MTKTGKPFCIFSIEDLSGNMEIALFGEDYGKIKQFLEPESLLHIRARVQNRFKKEDDFEVKPYSVNYLTDIGDKLSKELVLPIKLSDLTGSLGQKIGDLLLQHQGGTTVRFKVHDDEKYWNLPFLCKGLKVRVNNTLVEELTRLTKCDVTVG
jgi:DNA polymerase-3 subunit alpha